MHQTTFYITFAVLWTFVESFINLSGIKEWNPWCLRGGLLGILVISILVHVLKNKKRKYSTGVQLRRNCEKAILMGLNYLENANLNSNGQRMRLAPSIMETATVIGAINIASVAIGKTPQDNQKLMSWMFSGLKSRFRNGARVKFFGCSECNGVKDCNVAFFDYLSHFYYAKGTRLFEYFLDEFSFMSEILRKGFIGSNGQYGWGDIGQNKINIFETCTNLILDSIFKVLSEEEIKEVLLCICSRQEKTGRFIGMFKNANDDYIGCSGNYSLITTHRALEALSIYRDSFDCTSLNNEIEESINLGIIYLKSSTGFEKPVNYETKVGIDECELLRGTGHIVQALVKVKSFDPFLERQINNILDMQETNGSFIGHTKHFEKDKERDLTNNTDLTAFMVRTLSIFVISTK